MLEKLKDIYVIGIIAILAMSVFAPRSCSNSQLEVVSDTTRITIYDTIPYFEPKPKDSVNIGNITIKLPVVNNQKDSASNKKHSNDISKTVSNNETENKPDSINIELPITQKIYEDSTYKAYISGFNPSLDSILIFPKNEVQTVTIKSKPKRWGIGIQVGYGVTLSPTPKFAPYIGVGISYNLFSW